MNNRTAVMVFLVSVLVSACQKPAADVQDADVIQVTAGVADTRAGYYGREELPHEFFMDIKQGEDEDYNYSLVKMTKSAGNAYKPEEGKELLWASKYHGNAAVKAMTVPYGATAIDPDLDTEIAVNPDQSSAENLTAGDILVCDSSVEGDVSFSGANLALRFRHLLSRLEIDYEYGAGLTADKVIFNTVTVSDVCVKGYFDYSSMTLYDSMSLYDPESYLGDVKMYNDVENNRLEALFVPFNPSLVTPILTINATIDGVERTFACDLLPKTDSGFESGKCYRMSIKVLSESISLSSLSIQSGWDAQTENKSFETE